MLKAAGDTGGLRLYHPEDPRSAALPEELRRLLNREAQPASIRDKVRPTGVGWGGYYFVDLGRCCLPEGAAAAAATRGAAASIQDKFK